MNREIRRIAPVELRIRHGAYKGSEADLLTEGRTAVHTVKLTVFIKDLRADAIRGQSFSIHLCTAVQL